MPGHDVYARLTPYELSFPDLAFARRHFAAIREEAEARAVDVSDPTAFVMLAATGKVLREIRGPDDEPALIRQYGLLLYHSFHFSEAGEPLYLLRTAALRELLDPRSALAWEPGLVGASAYVQFPQHLVWIRAAPETPPESLDGFFYTRGGEEQFGLLFAMGMRSDRPGLSVVPLSGLPLEEAPDWANMEMREGGGDFTSSLPGSEHDGLYELRSSGEALKLAMRVVHLLRSAGQGEQPWPVESTQEGPAPSALSYRFVGPFDEQERHAVSAPIQPLERRDP